MMRLAPRLALLLALLLGACSNAAVREDVRTLTPARAPIGPFETCVVTTYREPADSMAVIEQCDEVTLRTFPPTSGDRYQMTAAWGTYAAPVPWGFLLHSMEHGGVVLAYRCDEGCPGLLEELEALADSIDDPLCRDEDVPRRIIIVPVPDLEVAVAALAWEHAYLATCLDPPSLREFVDDHYGMAPEDFCLTGLDLSADGWCG